MQVFFNGLALGAAIALTATAFQIVYLPTRIFFVGLAGVYSAAPFIAYAVLRCDGGWPVAILAATSGCVVVSLLSEWANHARLARRNASDGAHLIASLGMYIIIVQIVAMVWGNDTKVLRAGLLSTTDIGSLVVTGAQWRTLSAAAVLIGGFAFFLMRSDLGVRLRALAENPVQFALFGYDVERHRLLAFAISGFLAATSSLLVSYDVGFEPHVGLDALLLAIVAVIIGGRDSFLGPAFAGILLGVVRAEVAWFLTARWQDAATFALLVLFLFLRPQGIFGQKLRLEART